MSSHVCANMSELCDELGLGAGALLLTQEALAPDSAARLVAALRGQPAWSDVPVVVLVSRGGSAPLAPHLGGLLDADVNVTLLERPVRVTTLASAFGAALRARRRQYELRDQLQALSVAEADERRALERARRLQSLTVQLGRSVEAEVVFEQIVDALADLLDATILGLYLLEQPEADFTSAAARGLERAPGGTRLPRRASLAGRAVDEHRTIAVEDVSQDEGVVLPRLVGGPPVGAVAVAPILADGEPLGALEVYSPKPRWWDPDELELLTAFAAAASVAISNVRRHQQERQAIQARDDFLAAASHDLKNPLTAIRGSVQMLERTLNRTGSVPPERLKHSIRTISGAAARMTSLIEELLDVARLRMGERLALERAPTDLVALAREQVALQQAATEHHRLVVDAEVPALVGAWDSRRLQRVLENLLSNAIKYSPAGGEIVVTIGREADSAVLAVRDRGIGIPAADLPHIFDRFRRAANVLGRIEGTGIGLAASAQIVKEHGGTLDVQSREGEGTVVTVRLPLNEAAASRA
jgi:signal transduction histidine kinase